MEPKIFVYKIVADNGGAPCVWRGLLSLALCKPKIRKSAMVGSWIFGFGGKEYEERLIYIAEVTDKPPTGDYYKVSRFDGRPDCIYQPFNGKAELKATARYHTQSDERRKDVGLRFENAHVLLSRNFRYFGRRGTFDYKTDTAFRAIRHLIENLKRGHRVNHTSELRTQLWTLKERLWRKHRGMKIGSPIDSDCNKLCNADTPSVSC